MVNHRRVRKFETGTCFGLRKNQLIGTAIVCIMVVSAAGFISLTYFNPTPNGSTTPTTPLSEPTLEPPEGLHYSGVNISFLKIMGFKLKYDDIVVYIDPAYFLPSNDDAFLERADYILISHDHPTHTSSTAVRRLSDTDTIIMAAARPAEVIEADYVVKPGDVLDFDRVTFEFVPSYCYSATILYSEQPMHEQSYNNTGVIVDFEGTRIYHAGDTDRIPEMKTFVADIAILPVSDTPNNAWMNVSEAVNAVDDLMINSDLKYAIPTHWDIGPGWDVERRYYAEDFAELANCTVVILDSLY
jgi:L-ascorbate metabolism protein UlaG (beta-lactamase superfamily)